MNIAKKAIGILFMFQCCSGSKENDNKNIHAFVNRVTYLDSMDDVSADCDAYFPRPTIEIKVFNHSNRDCRIVLNQMHISNKKCSFYAEYNGRKAALFVMNDDGFIKRKSGRIVRLYFERNDFYKIANKDIDVVKFVNNFDLRYNYEKCAQNEVVIDDNKGKIEIEKLKIYY